MITTRFELELDRFFPNPWQTRRHSSLEDIQELADDILANSLIHAPLGRRVDVDQRPHPQGDYVQLAVGHNRLAAYKLLAEHYGTAWMMIPVEIRQLSDEQMADYAWAENEQRREVSPMDRAYAVQKRIQDFGWTQIQAAKHLHLSTSAVSNILRLLELPENLQKDLDARAISERQAMAMLPLFRLPEEQLPPQAESIFEQARSGVSSETLRQEVRDVRDSGSTSAAAPPRDYRPDQGVSGLLRRADHLVDWVDQLSQTPPSPESLMDDLDTLFKLRDDVADMIARLTDLHAILTHETWSGANFADYVPHLVQIPPTADNFKRYLNDCPAPLLAYTLALVSGLEGHGVRAGMLRSRLNALVKGSPRSRPGLQSE